ncbi:hypothetical protein GCM10023332_01810 [Luteimonas vadosa]|uniref:Tetratricopeptide repeat protein n=1 Tax=Luteimonas vadosa TaxID=1165507 RepID=A0ABP9DS35_9GAMM
MLPVIGGLAVLGVAQHEAPLSWPPPTTGEMPLLSEGGEAPRSRVSAHARLRERPLDGMALRSLANDVAVNEGLVAALPLYEIAVRRAPRNPSIRGQLFTHYVELERWQQAMQQLDAWLRLDPVAAEPFLAEWIGRRDTPMLALLAVRLAQDAPWQSVAWPLLAEHGQERALRIVLETLAALRPLHAHELALYLPMLERTGDAGRAREVWMETSAVSKAVDRVYDGGFEFGVGPSPYGWQWGGVASGYYSGIDSAAPWEGRNAMAWRFPGRDIKFAPLQQALVLAPGVYRLTVHARAELDMEAGSFVWTVMCRAPVGSADDLPRATILASMPVPARTQGWQELSTPLVVDECPLQRLQLQHVARGRGQSRVSGGMAFDGVSIESMHATAIPGDPCRPGKPRANVEASGACREAADE